MPTSKKGWNNRLTQESRWCICHTHRICRSEFRETNASLTQTHDRPDKRRPTVTVERLVRRGCVCRRDFVSRREYPATRIQAHSLQITGSRSTDLLPKQETKVDKQTLKIFQSSRRASVALIAAASASPAKAEAPRDSDRVEHEIPREG